MRDIGRHCRNIFEVQLVKYTEGENENWIRNRGRYIRKKPILKVLAEAVVFLKTPVGGDVINTH